MQKKKIIGILIVLLIAISTICVVSAIGKTTDLKEAHGLKVESNGNLVDTYHSNKVIGNVTPIESVAAGEEIISSNDPNYLEDTLSANPLVTEYIVEQAPGADEGGIYFMFGHDGNIYLGFVKTENMGNGMLKRMTEFAQYNGVV